MRTKGVLKSSLRTIRERKGLAMRTFAITAITVAILLTVNVETSAQADEICREFGETPTREVDRINRQAPYIYGRIILKGLAPNAKLPRIIVVYTDSRQPTLRQVISRSGNYCFKRAGTGGIIMIEVEGLETARKNVSDIGEPRQREDFELYLPQTQQNATPGVVSTRFTRSANDKTSDLYKKAAEAESDKQPKKAIEFVKEIVAIDTEDFIAWAKLGSLYVAVNSPQDAEAAFTRSLELRPDYPTALINFGMLRAFQNQFDAAVALFERAVLVRPKIRDRSSSARRIVSSDPERLARPRRSRQSSRARPVRSGRMSSAKSSPLRPRRCKTPRVRRIQCVSQKIPDHADKKKFEKYIKDNRPQ